MKNFSKNFLPELHLNPITRDLIWVFMISLLVAVAVVTFGVMIIGQL